MKLQLMKGIFTIALSFVLRNWSYAQVHEICTFMASDDTLMVQSDSIVLVPNGTRTFNIPEGWHGSVNFEGPRSLSLKRTYVDSTELFLIASEVWLVEFHDEFIKQQTSTSIEYCEFDLKQLYFHSLQKGGRTNNNILSNSTDQ
jgi:hypothetical protein